jgi:hypothetical protein
MKKQDHNNGRSLNGADAKLTGNIAVLEEVNSLLSKYGIEVVMLSDGVEYDLWIEKKS